MTQTAVQYGWRLEQAARGSFRHDLLRGRRHIGVGVSDWRRVLRWAALRGRQEQSKEGGAGGTAERLATDESRVVKALFARCLGYNGSHPVMHM